MITYHIQISLTTEYNHDTNSSFARPLVQDFSSLSNSMTQRPPRSRRSASTQSECASTARFSARTMVIIPEPAAGYSRHLCLTWTILWTKDLKAQHTI